MTKMSIMDKLQVLLEVSKSSKVFIIVIISLLFLAYMFMTINKKNMKSSKITYLITYAIIIASLLFTYKDSLKNMFDYLVNNLFIIIYFPNLAIYLTAIIITNIIIWISLFKTNVSKIIKNINIIVYCVMTYLLILILNIINVNNLDVFTQSSVYSNNESLALIELSSTIFLTWISFLIVYLIIRRFQKNNENQKTVVKEKTISTKMPKDYKLVEVPYYVKQDTKAIKVEKNIAKTTNAYDELLTLNDYKLLLNILKDHKKKELEEQEKQRKIEEEQTKYRQLQELYKSIR